MLCVGAQRCDGSLLVKFRKKLTKPALINSKIFIIKKNKQAGNGFEEYIHHDLHPRGTGLTIFLMEPVLYIFHYTKAGTKIGKRRKKCSQPS